MKTGKAIWAYSMILSLLLVGAIAYLTLFKPNWHTDNLYNLGMVRRSLLPGSGSLLETSYLHWYSEPYLPVRPEDWHRGLSLLMLVGIGRMAGGAELVLRIPHFVWACSWLLIAAWLARELACSLSAREGNAVDKKPGLLPFFALSGALLLFTPWAGPVLSASYLDDLPAAVCVLAGVAILLAERLDYRRMVAAGGCIGISLWMKDLYLIWLLLGPVVVIIALVTERRRSLAAISGLVGVFSVTMLLVFAPKLAWNYHDLGTMIPNAARSVLKSNLLWSRIDGEHQPLFLFPNMVLPKNHWLLMKSAGVLYCLNKGWREVIAFYAATWGAWLWLPLSCSPVLLNRFRPHVFSRAIIFCVSISLAYTTVFVLQMAQMGGLEQIRYWLVPLTLVVVTGAGALPSVLNEMRRLTVTAGILFALLIMPVVAMTMSASKTVDNLRLITGHGVPYSYDAQKVFHGAIALDGTGLVETNRGVHYWTHHPEDRLVSVKSHVAISLPQDKFVELLDHYRVSAALVQNSYLAALLQMHDFSQIYGNGDVVVLVRQPVSPKGSAE